MRKGESASNKHFLLFQSVFNLSKNIFDTDPLTLIANVFDMNKSHNSSLVRNQSTENAGVAFVKGANERNEFLEKK